MNDVDAIVGRSRHQWRLAIFFAALNVGAALDEQLNDGEMTFFRRNVECSEAIVGSSVDLGAAIEQQRNAAQLTVVDRMIERRGAVLVVARLDVSVIVEQQRSNIDVTFLNSAMQCSKAGVIGSVDVGAVRNQLLDFAEFAECSRENERRKAILVAFVDIRIASNDFDFL